MSYNDYLKFLGKIVITTDQMNAMDVNEVGKVVAIPKNIGSNINSWVVVQFNSCKNKEILHDFYGISYSDCIISNGFDYNSMHKKRLFYFVYLNCLKILDND